MADSSSVGVEIILREAKMMLETMVGPDSVRILEDVKRVGNLEGIFYSPLRSKPSQKFLLTFQKRCKWIAVGGGEEC